MSYVSKEKISILQTEAGLLQNKYEELKKQTGEKERELKTFKELNGTKKKTPFNIPLFISAVCMCVAAVLLFYTVSVTISVACAVVAVLLFVLSLIIKPKLNYNKNIIEIGEEIASLSNSRDEISKKQTAIQSELSTLSAELKADDDLKQERTEKIKRKEEALCLEEKKCEEAKKLLLEYFAKYKECFDTEEVKQALKSFTAPLEEKKRLKTVIDMLISDIGDISAEEAEKRLAALKTGEEKVDFSAQKEKYFLLMTVQKTELGR